MHFVVDLVIYHLTVSSRILRDECRQWYNTVMATETEAPIMPNVILDDLQ